MSYLGPTLPPCISGWSRSFVIQRPEDSPMARDWAALVEHLAQGAEATGDGRRLAEVHGSHQKPGLD